VLHYMSLRGRFAAALDLPGNGFNKSVEVADVTMDHYAIEIERTIKTYNPNDKIILVGHSSGGFPITACAERSPNIISRLIYLCAYVPNSGDSVESLRKKLAGEGKSFVGKGIADYSSDGITLEFNPDRSPGQLYHDCSAEAVTFAMNNLMPQPTRPQKTPVILTRERSGSVPASYILCTEDRIISPQAQETMTADWPSQTVHSIPSGHSPFLSCPEHLVNILCSIADNE
jgi:pimeloyl-ACP methyl ester carboxylesterase